MVSQIRLNSGIAPLRPCWLHVAEMAGLPHACAISILFAHMHHALIRQTYDLAHAKYFEFRRQPRNCVGQPSEKIVLERLYYRCVITNTNTVNFALLTIALCGYYVPELTRRTHETSAPFWPSPGRQ
jgi:hypothetical protein